MTTLAVLQLICGGLTINLLRPRNGFHVQAHRAQAVQPKDSGTTWRDSPLAAGRQLAATVADNVQDQYTLTLDAMDADEAAKKTGDLRYLLSLARNYWAQTTALHSISGTSYLPLIRARAHGETNDRYSLLYDGRFPEDGEIFATPFIQQDCRVVLTNLPLVLEHGPWRDLGDTYYGIDSAFTLPCSTLQAWAGTQTVITSSPAQSEDDAFALLDGATWVSFGTGGTKLYLGNIAPDEFPVLTGIRFPNITVPAGATITQAYVTFHATDSKPGTDCRVTIFAEDEDNPTIFSTLQDFVGRLKKPLAQVAWPLFDDGITSIEPFVAGNTYNTPELKTVIQAQINRTGWASGNAIVLFFYDDESDNGVSRFVAAWDHATDPAAVLTIIYEYGTTDFGQEETTLTTNFISNKHTKAQLTHVYRHDASAGTYTNLVGTAKPVDLFPNPIANTDTLYFGINTGLVNSGPFDSLVFTITNPAVYTNTAALNWEYWSGAAWSTLTVTDNTSDNTGPFSVGGNASVHWVPPSGWATTVVNGVTGYWVRCQAILAGGDTVTTPQQDERDIYTICIPYVDGPATVLPGDLLAIGRIYLVNWSDQQTAPKVELWANRVLMGIRSIERGDLFSAYINLSDNQIPSYVDITLVSTLATFQSGLSAPTGRCIRYDPTGAAPMATFARVTISRPLHWHYNGIYRAFLRCKQTGGTVGDIGFRLGVSNGWYTTNYTPTVYLDYTSDFQLLDLGRITLPVFTLTPIEQSEIFLLLQAVSTSSGTPYLYCYDLILLPVDEYALDAYDPTGYSRIGDTLKAGNRYLDLDSLTDPREMLRALVRFYDGRREPMGAYQVISNSPVTFPIRRNFRFWFLSTRIPGSSVTPERRADPAISFAFEAYRALQFAHLRGAS